MYIMGGFMIRIVQPWVRSIRWFNCAAKMESCESYLGYVRTWRSPTYTSDLCDSDKTLVMGDRCRFFSQGAWGSCDPGFSHLLPLYCSVSALGACYCTATQRKFLMVRLGTVSLLAGFDSPISSVYLLLWRLPLE